MQVGTRLAWREQDERVAVVRADLQECYSGWPCKRVVGCPLLQLSTDMSYVLLYMSLFEPTCIQSSEEHHVCEIPIDHWGLETLRSHSAEDCVLQTDILQLQHSPTFPSCTPNRLPRHKQLIAKMRESATGRSTRGHFSGLDLLRLSRQ